MQATETCLLLKLRSVPAGAALILTMTVVRLPPPDLLSSGGRAGRDAREWQQSPWTTKMCKWYAAWVPLGAPSLAGDALETPRGARRAAGAKAAAIQEVTALSDRTR